MIVPLQYLRGVAALMVVYHHADFQISKVTGSSDLPLAALGAAGVDIFFVISGFIMWVSTSSAPPTPQQFMRRRFIRITPLYWLITLVVLGLSFSAPRLFSTIRFDLGHAFWSFLYIPVYHPQVQEQILPFFIQGWTLNYEMFFYLTFAFALACTSRRSGHFLVVGALFSGLVLMGILRPPRSAVGVFYSSWLLLEFLLGMAIGLMYPVRRSFGRLAVPLAGLGGAALILSTGWTAGFGPNGVDPHRFVLWGVPAAIVVAGAVHWQGHVGPSLHAALMKMGDSSYSLYLSHILTLPAVMRVWRRLGLPVEGVWLAGLVGVLLASSVGVGWLMFRWVERPMSRSLREASAPSGGRSPAVLRPPGPDSTS